MFKNDDCTACEADARMTVEHQGSTLTNMDMEDIKIAYKQLSGGSKLRYSGNKKLMHQQCCSNKFVQIATLSSKRKSFTLKTPYSCSHLYIWHGSISSSSWILCVFIPLSTPALGSCFIYYFAIPLNVFKKHKATDSVKHFINLKFRFPLCYLVHSLRNSPTQMGLAGLGLLCVLLLAGVIGQSVHCESTPFVFSVQHSHI